MEIFLIFASWPMKAKIFTVSFFYRENLLTPALKSQSRRSRGEQSLPIIFFFFSWFTLYLSPNHMLLNSISVLGIFFWISIMEGLSFTSLSSAHTSISPSSQYSFNLVASVFIVWYYDCKCYSQLYHIVYCDDFLYKIYFRAFQICLFCKGLWGHWFCIFYC